MPTSCDPAPSATTTAHPGRFLVTAKAVRGLVVKNPATFIAPMKVSAFEQELTTDQKQKRQQLRRASMNNAGSGFGGNHYAAPGMDTPLQMQEEIVVGNVPEFLQRFDDAIGRLKQEQRRRGSGSQIESSNSHTNNKEQGLKSYSHHLSLVNAFGVRDCLPTTTNRSMVSAGKGTTSKSTEQLLLQKRKSGSSPSSSLSSKSHHSSSIDTTKATECTQRRETRRASRRRNIAVPSKSSLTTAAQQLSVASTIGKDVSEFLTNLEDCAFFDDFEVETTQEEGSPATVAGAAATEETKPSEVTSPSVRRSSGRIRPRSTAVVGSELNESSNSHNTNRQDTATVVAANRDEKSATQSKATNKKSPSSSSSSSRKSVRKQGLSSKETKKSEDFTAAVTPETESRDDSAVTATVTTELPVPPCPPSTSSSPSPNAQERRKTSTVKRSEGRVTARSRVSVGRREALEEADTATVVVELSKEKVVQDTDNNEDTANSCKEEATTTTTAKTTTSSSRNDTIDNNNKSSSSSSEKESKSLSSSSTKKPTKTKSAKAVETTTTDETADATASQVTKKSSKSKAAKKSKSTKTMDDTTPKKKKSLRKTNTKHMEHDNSSSSLVTSTTDVSSSTTSGNSILSECYGYISAMKPETSRHNREVLASICGGMV